MKKQGQYDELEEELEEEGDNDILHEQQTSRTPDLSVFNDPFSNPNNPYSPPPRASMRKTWILRVLFWIIVFCLVVATFYAGMTIAFRFNGGLGFSIAFLGNTILLSVAGVLSHLLGRKYHICGVNDCCCFVYP